MKISNITSGLKKGKDGIWYAKKIARISYPNEGNDACWEIEDKSFWFKHRNACLIELVKKFPPHDKGPIFDVGGGNGFVANALIDTGFEVVLVEPNPSGVKNAKKRGLKNIICGTTTSAGFKKRSLPAICLFDVLEHIKDDARFLQHLCDLLVPGGMLYLATPSYKFLWSMADEYAGHFRRYSPKNLRLLFCKAGLKIQFITGIFMWLIIPTILFRALPYRLTEKYRTKIKPADRTIEDHTLPGWLLQFVRNCDKWECSRISRGSPIPFGASLLVAAKKSE